MSCLTIAALALRLAAPDPGAFIETDCGVQIGITDHDHRPAPEVVFQHRLIGPLYARAAIQAYRTADRDPPITTIIQHGPGIHTMDYSTTRVRAEDVGVEAPEPVRHRNWHIRPSVSIGASLPVAGPISAWAEAEPLTGRIQAGIRLRF